MRPSIIRFLKKLDSLSGPLIVSLARWGFPSPTRGERRLKRFLIVRPGGIGDGVLLVPAILSLKKAFQNVSIVILAEKRNASVFSLCPEKMLAVFCYDKINEFVSATRLNYDVVIDAEQWHRLSAVIARLTKAPILIGYGTNEREKLFTHAISYSHQEYEQNSFMNLICPLLREIPPPVKPPFLEVPPSARETVEQHLRSFTGKKFIAIFPGGSVRERRWGGRRFRSVACKLIDGGFRIVVVGGKEDILEGKAIAEGLFKALNLCGKLSLVQTAAVLKESALLITGDSGIMHVGFGLGIKTLSLFGPGIEKKWAPQGSGHFVINKNLDCSPCTKFGYTPKCKRNAECMKRITVDEVVHKALEMLEG